MSILNQACKMNWVAQKFSVFKPSSRNQRDVRFAPLLILISLIAPLSSSTSIADPRTPPQTARATFADSAEFPEVEMNEYMITSVSRFSLIESSGATTCVMVTLWDPQTSIGVLAHISASIDSEASFAKIFARLQQLGVNPSRLQARMIGGWKGWSEPIVKGIDTVLKERGVRVVELDVLNPNVPTPRDIQQGAELHSQGSGTKNIIFDLRVGRAYDYSETIAPRGGHHDAPSATVLQSVRESL